MPMPASPHSRTAPQALACNRSGAAPWALPPACRTPRRPAKNWAHSEAAGQLEVGLAGQQGHLGPRPALHAEAAHGVAGRQAGRHSRSQQHMLTLSEHMEHKPLASGRLFQGIPSPSSNCGRGGGGGQHVRTQHACTGETRCHTDHTAGGAVPHVSAGCLPASQVSCQPCHIQPASQR